MDRTEIIVKDGNRYVYTADFVNIENPLGVVKATLKEYSIYKLEDREIFIGKLYRTKEHSWYDMPDTASINPLLRTMIKMAIDESEKNDALVDATDHDQPM